MQVLKKSIIGLSSIMIISCLMGCETYGPINERVSKSSNGQAATEQKDLLTEPLPEFIGPKPTVVVGKFDAVESFTSTYGGGDIGGGLSAMLITALIESGRFNVLDRANLSQTIAEQEPKAAGVSFSETDPSLGKPPDSDFLIYGYVTEFGIEDKGGDVSVDFAGSGFGNLFNTALSRKTQSGSVAIDLRLVDTTTGKIINSHSIKESIESSDWGISGDYKGLSIGTKQFNTTPLGEACRQAITRIVHYIARKAQNKIWTGRIVTIDGPELYINAGYSSGLKVGHKFMVEHVDKELIDPETGEVLSLKKRQLGIIQISGVEEKISFGSFLPFGEDSPQRGDLVVASVR